MRLRKKDKRFKFPHVTPEISEWPIHELYENRDAVKQSVVDITAAKIFERSDKDLSDLIAKSIYMERIRIKASTWKVDPKDEKLFWKGVHNTHTEGLKKSPEEARSINEQIIRNILERYAEEILGNFKKKTFKFARKFLTALFSQLLNAAGGKYWTKIYGKRLQLQERIITHGHIDEIRELSKNATVILVPTHFSNLDSILIGYACDLIGIPAFSYGAGLNLFNSSITAHYMGRLGAYKVDRRKRNPIYLEALKSFSAFTIEEGVNTLFFPGGTRSRSGSLEGNLKLGLLSTAIGAQREHYRKGKDEKIVIVPLILGYHFVLEAKALIHQYLKGHGKEKYAKIDQEKYGIMKIFQYIWKFFAKSSEIYLNFGEPIDVLGNKVNNQGESFDKNGKAIDISTYFSNNGEITVDIQRENEYTKNLSNHIKESYFKENIILSSHLVAFAAFNIIRAQNETLDLFGVLRLPTDEYRVSIEKFKAAIEDVKVHLHKMEENGELILSENIDDIAEELIQDGIDKLGLYHTNSPLKFTAKDKQYLGSESWPILYYYHNRIAGYGLETAVDWKKYAFEVH